MKNYLYGVTSGYVTPSSLFAISYISLTPFEKPLVIALRENLRAHFIVYTPKKRYYE